MRICVFEDRGVERLEPLTLTRPAFDLWGGFTSLLTRQQRHFAATATAVLVRPPLADWCRQAHPDLAVNDTAWLRTGANVLVNARWLAPPGRAPAASPCVALTDGQTAYIVPPPGRPIDADPAATDAWLQRCAEGLPRTEGGGRMIDYAWSFVALSAEAFAGFELPAEQRGQYHRPPQVTILGPEDRLFVHKDAQIDPLVVADTTGGPVVVEREAIVKAFSCLEGPCYIGRGTWLMRARVSASTIGPVCRIGGDVEVSVIQGYSNKGHEGFIGHSYLGEWVNLAAGTQVSDLRTDYGEVMMTVAGQKIATGMSKVGCFLGDHTKTGINALLNTGTMTGTFCYLFPSNLLPPRVIPSFCSFSRGQVQEGGDLEELFATAVRVMQRRNVELTEAQKSYYRWLHEHTSQGRQQAIREQQLRSQRPSK
jgi:UDP-N-acetylglucosamine diphosphorylase/glucosamine-1-phosphate N-acetyltransferase